MAQKLDHRSIKKYDVETLFQDVLTLEQIKQIGNLLKLLGLYVFVNRQQLGYFAESHFGNKIGLSTLQMAVKYNLITEMHSDEDYKTYYFKLKSGGHYFLGEIGYVYRRLPLDAAINERKKILSINNILIERKYKLRNASYLFEPLITTNNILLLHKKSEKDSSVKETLKAMPHLTVEIMYLTDVPLSVHNKGNIDSML